MVAKNPLVNVVVNTLAETSAKVPPKNATQLTTKGKSRVAEFARINRMARTAPSMNIPRSVGLNWFGRFG